MKPLDKPLPYRHALLVVLIGLWLAALTLTHTPQGKLGELDRELDMTYLQIHFVGYLGLATSFWLTLRAYGVGRMRRVLAILIIMPTYAVLDELTQPWFGRHCALKDMITDSLAALVALGVAELVQYLCTRKTTLPDRPAV